MTGITFPTIPDSQLHQNLRWLAIYQAANALLNAAPGSWDRVVFKKTKNGQIFATVEASIDGKVVCEQIPIPTGSAVP